MKFRSAAVLLAAGAALLSACGDDAPTPESGEDAERNAQGEVLGGTISDDMLPLDRLRSQSPPLREAPATASGAPAPEATDAAAAGDEADAAPEAEAPAAAAPEPAD